MSRSGVGRHMATLAIGIENRVEITVSVRGKLLFPSSCEVFVEKLL
jgi:hypothetical protein